MTKEEYRLQELPVDTFTFIYSTDWEPLDK